MNTPGYECPVCHARFEQKPANCPSCMIREMNRQYRERSWWKKIKDWWKAEGEGVAMNEEGLTIDQYLLLRIWQYHLATVGSDRRLIRVTWILVLLGFITLFWIVYQGLE